MSDTLLGTAKPDKSQGTACSHQCRLTHDSRAFRCTQWSEECWVQSHAVPSATRKSALAFSCPVARLQGRALHPSAEERPDRLAGMKQEMAPSHCQHCR